MAAEDEYARVHLANFSAALTNRQKWFARANELTAAASQLEPHVLAWWHSLNEWSKRRIRIFREHGLHEVYMMLSAYAVEALCKGHLASMLKADERDLVRSSGKLPEHLRTHDLLTLVRRCGMDVSLEEEDLLRRMRRAAVWAARYPVATDHRRADAEQFSDGAKYSTSCLAASDVYGITALVGRLRQHLGARESLRVPLDPP